VIEWIVTPENDYPVPGNYPEERISVSEEVSCFLHLDSFKRNFSFSLNCFIKSFSFLQTVWVPCWASYGGGFFYCKLFIFSAGIVVPFIRLFSIF
jgi:hypothetical protein